MIAGLAACSGVEVKESLGLLRDAPDEFRVVSRPPLTVPKEFYLRPPSTAARSQTSQPAHLKARSRVIKAGNERAEIAPGMADARLLERMGVDLSASAASGTSVRGILWKEEMIRKQEEPDMIDRLRGDTNAEPVVDAQAEAERLHTNREEGKPVTEGETPVHDPKRKTTLERLFE